MQQAAAGPALAAGPGPRSERRGVRPTAMVDVLSWPMVAALGIGLRLFDRMVADDTRRPDAPSDGWDLEHVATAVAGLVRLVAVAVLLVGIGVAR